MRRLVLRLGESRSTEDTSIAKTDAMRVPRVGRAATALVRTHSHMYLYIGRDRRNWEKGMRKRFRVRSYGGAPRVWYVAVLLARGRTHDTHTRELRNVTLRDLFVRRDETRLGRRAKHMRQTSLEKAHSLQLGSVQFSFDSDRISIVWEEE